MSKTFFIADTHFGDADIIRYENRPFSSVKEMDEVMILNWNSVVSNNDTVFVVGDFISNLSSFNILFKLNGKIKLIVGNHDIPFLKEYEEYKNVEVINYSILLDNFWLISHEPMYVTAQSPYANIFGHIHNNPMYKTVSIRSYCVCVERNRYMPVLFDDIKELIRKENHK